MDQGQMAFAGNNLLAMRAALTGVSLKNGVGPAHRLDQRGRQWPHG
jgi:hypothetical protein